MLSTTLILFLIGLASLGLNVYLLVQWLRRKPREATFVSAPTVERLQELADLVVVRVQIADVLEATHPDGAKIAVLLRGDCDYTVELATARLFSDAQEHVATVELKPPQVSRPRVNHERTRIYDIRRTTWLPWVDPRDELLKSTMEKAQSVVEAAARDDRYADYARLHAEAVIKAFYRRIGWTVDIVWVQPATSEAATTISASAASASATSAPAGEPQTPADRGSVAGSATDALASPVSAVAR